MVKDYTSALKFCKISKSFSIYQELITRRAGLRVEQMFDPGHNFLTMITIQARSKKKIDCLSTRVIMFQFSGTGS